MTIVDIIIHASNKKWNSKLSVQTKWTPDSQEELNQSEVETEVEISQMTDLRRRMGWPFGMFYSAPLLDGTLACDAGI